MTRYLVTAILALMTLASSFGQVPAYVPGQALVRFSSEAVSGLSFSLEAGAVIPSDPELASLFEHLGVWKVEPLHPHDVGNALGGSAGLNREFVVYFRHSLQTDYSLGLMRSHPKIEKAQLNHLYSLGEDPIDPYYSSQWALPKISMPSAWDITHGTSSVRIAVLDAGFKLNHGDLSGKFSATYRRDETSVNVAYYRDVLHWVPIAGEDYTVPDNDPTTTKEPHGTGVAGVAAAQTNNNPLLGVAGVAWNNQVVPVRCGFTMYPYGGFVETDDWIRALDWVRNQSAAKVVNMSFGRSYLADDEDPLEENAIDLAVGAGIVVCVASGNYRGGGWDPDSVCFPAAYDNAIAVGSTNSTDWVANSSCIGSKLELVAPGVDVYTSWYDKTSGVDTYEPQTGTSYAAPHVAGVAALMLSINPTLSPAQVREILTQTADDLPQMGGQPFTIYYGHGRLNAHQALLLALGFANKSWSSQSTAFNGQKKLFAETSGKLHEVFASGTITQGEIFYRNSTNGGTSWSNAVRLSDGTATSLAPCITMSSATTNVIVTWQQTNGSNYNVLFRRSTNGGTAWGSITTLQSNFSCASPGPLPTVSGNTQTNRVVVVYRTSSGLRSIASPDNMTTWGTPVTVTSTASHNSPSTAYYANEVNNCNLAFATDVGSSSLISYSSYTGSWSAVANLSSVVPTSYQGQRKPSVATTTSVSPPLCHVAWEATYIPGGSTPVIIHRKGTSGNFGSQFSVINSPGAMNPSIAGLTGDNAWMVFQNTQMGKVDRVRYSFVSPDWVWGTPSSGPTGNHGQISVGSSTAKYLYTSGTATPYTVALGSEILTKEDVLVAQYARELNLIDEETGASLTLEIEQAEVIHQDGTLTAVRFKDAPPDSVLIPVEEIFRYGELKPFTFSGPTDTLKVRYSVRSVKAEEILAEAAEAAYTFTLRDRKTGEILSTLMAVPVAKSAGMTSAAGEIALSGLQIQGLEAGAELILEVSFSGVKEDRDGLIASLGHIYRYAGEGAVELPKEVVAEDLGPKSYHLQQNYPNPFNPSTTLRYALPEAAHVRLIVYNTLGQQVAGLVEGERTAGYHEVKWEAVGLASGIYFARLTVTGSLGQMITQQTTKLVLMR